MASESNLSKVEGSTTNLGDDTLLPRNIPRDPTASTKLRKKPSKPKSTLASSYDSSQSTAASNSTNTRSQQEKQKRRKHKNSKLGCPNCKQRRVKCSEDLPSCANCIKHKVECGYLSYTKEEIEELKQAKLERLQAASEQKGDSKSESEEVEEQLEFNSNKRASLDDGNGESRKRLAPNNSKKSLQPHNKQKLVKLLHRLSQNYHHQRPDSHSMSNSASQATGLDTNIMTHVQIQDTTPNFNTNGQTVIQNFDNLLGHELGGPENSIIFPVYRMSENQTPEVGNIQNCYPDTGPLPSTPASMQLSNALPGAIHKPTLFTISRDRNRINYVKENDDLFAKTNLGIIQGQMTLEPIRHVYWTWLKSFVDLGTTHPLRFYCLLNICANYLISVCFDGSYGLYSFGGRTSTPVERQKELAHMRQTCLVKTIQYYDEVIKRLRTMLAENSPDPDAACTVSYMLSLTSIYDPERSLHSTICYREGLFDMLEYYNSKSRPADTPVIVQIELKLMTNIMMTGNLPAYNPMFLIEARQMLHSFGDILFPLCEVATASVDSDHPRIRTSQFLQLKYHQLLHFINEAIDVYIPQINDKITNLEVQQDLLYQMLTKWVVIFSSQLTFPTSSQGPLEKIMYLFYKFVKKALFTILPHVKFFFLRNFDGPILLDVYASDDYAIYQQLSHPPNLKVDSSIYEPHVEQLKYIAAFLIRGSTYIRKRLAILYPTLMRFIAMHDFQGSDINKWRKTIQDITALRAHFLEKMQVFEVNLNSFTNGYIKKSNYPLPGENGEFEDANLGDDYLSVDFTTLQPLGLLAGDYDPTSG